MNKLLALYKKNQEIINYIIFGVLTTIISWGVCIVLTYFVFGTEAVAANAMLNTLTNVIGWVAGVIFAYVTNRKWVFKSVSDNVAKEFIEFTSGRIATLVLELVVMFLFVNVMKIEYAIAKIIAGVLVVIANYVISKFFVFK